MQSSKLAIVVSALCILPLHAESVPESAGGWDIQAEAVEWSTGAKPVVTGRFRVDAPSASPESGASIPKGGACMVANLVPFGVGRATCTTHADCNGVDSIDRQRDPRLENFVGYCAKRDGSDEPLTCWTRPGPPGGFCKRSIDPWTMSGGTHQLGPVDGDPLGNGPPYPEWAVYACLAFLGHDRACGEPSNPNRKISLSPAN
jgi:hypothetical protein